MWRLTAFLKRNSAMAGDDFLAFLTGTWAPAVCAAGSGSASLKNIRIHLPLDLSGSPLESLFPPRFDALVEIAFEDFDSAVASLVALDRDPEVPDLGDALDLSDGAAWLGEVLPKKPDDHGRTGTRMTVAGDVIDGMAEGEAQRYWGEVHPVVAQRAPETWERLTLYRQVHGRRSSAIEEMSWLPRRYYPMCADMGAVSLEELLAAYDNDQYRAIVRPDEQKFSKPEDMLTFVTREYREVMP
jgi:hypothetical protein